MGIKQLVASRKANPFWSFFLFLTLPVWLSNANANGPPMGVQYETPKRTVEVKLDSGEKVAIQMWDEYTVIEAQNRNDIAEIKKMLVEVVENTRHINPNAKFEVLLLKGTSEAGVGYGRSDAAIMGEDIWTNVLGSEKRGEWSPDHSGRFEQAKKDLNSLLPEAITQTGGRIPIMMGTIGNDHKSSTVSYTIVRALSIYGVQQVSFVVGAGLPVSGSFLAAALSGLMSGFLQFQHAKFVNWMAGYGVNPMNPQLESHNKVSRALRTASRKSANAAEWLHKRSYFHKNDDNKILKTLEKLGLKWPVSLVADPAYFAAHFLQPVNPKKKGAWTEGIAKDFLISVIYYGTVRLALGMADPTVFAELGGFITDMMKTAAKGAATEGVAHFALASITKRFIEKDPSRKSRVILYSERTMVGFSLLITSMISLEILGLPLANASLTVIAVTGGAAWTLSKFEFTSKYVLEPFFGTIGKLNDRLAAIGGDLFKRLNGPTLLAIAKYFLSTKVLNNRIAAFFLDNIKSRLEKKKNEENAILDPRWTQLRNQFENRRRHVFGGGGCRALFAM